jgi:hypothetical protein
MASKSSYGPLIFAPIVGLLLLLTVAFLFVYTGAVIRAGARNPQIGAGAAQVADTASPAEQQAGVTTQTRDLPANEESKKVPEGQPENVPAGAPNRSPQQYPDSAR